MVNDKAFSVLNELPPGLSGGMHPDTKKIIERIRRTKEGQVLAIKLRTPKEAKNRIDALRKARARKAVGYKQAFRKADTLYVKLK